ncbi:MAG: hypothetical protein P9X24_02010 [Candidatus Hatepunaea meridiana]|nr:hypothetical protein [Candidatus Hatepunaea meridiana]
MSGNMEFQSFDQDAFKGDHNIFEKKVSVIKHKDVRMFNPVKIEINESEFEDNKGESIEPIIDDDCVVGIIYTCSCGKSTEIRFDYDDSN